MLVCNRCGRQTDSVEIEIVLTLVAMADQRSNDEWVVRRDSIEALNTDFTHIEKAMTACMSCGARAPLSELFSKLALCSYCGARCTDSVTFCRSLSYTVCSACYKTVIEKYCGVCDYSRNCLLYKKYHERRR